MLTEVSGGIGRGGVPVVAVKTHFRSRTHLFGFMVWVMVWVMVIVGAAAHAFAHPCPCRTTFLSALV